MVQIFKKPVLLFFKLTLLISSVQVMAKAPELTKKELMVAPPRIIRTCCGFGVEIGIAGIPFAKKTDITSRELIGPHHYLGNKSEKNGNIYTLRGGFIDLGHLRDYADWTGYLYNLIKECQKDPVFTRMELHNEGGSKTLVLNVPDNLDEETIIQLAGKISYDLSLWHEISTWFGARYVPLVPERFSSFSPEDMYSNLMGVHLGIRAIKSELEFNEAMTVELNKMLDTLEALTTENETFEAMLKVNNVWYTNQKSYPNKNVTLKRYIELDNYFSPWLVTGYISHQPPYELKKPDSSLSRYYQLMLKLNFRFPVDSLFGYRPDRIITQNEFDTFVEYIHNEIIKEESETLKRKSPKPVENQKSQ